MKKLIIPFFLFFSFTGMVAPGFGRNNILVIQSLRIAPFEKSLEGFKNSTNGAIHRVVISEQKSQKDIYEIIKTTSPDIILALGKEALLASKTIKSIPIVYAMVLNPEQVLSGEKNITGVSMKIPIEKYLLVFKKNMPHLKNLGVVYDPSKSGSFMKNAEEISRLCGIRLITFEISKPQNLPDAILNMKGRIDAYWMLPDLTVVTPESVEFMFLFSIENSIPIFTFSEKYVEMGAFLSMNISAFDMGQQAGEMAERILKGEKYQKMPYLYARQANVTTNLIVAQKLGITSNIALNTNKKLVKNIQLLGNE